MACVTAISRRLNAGLRPTDEPDGAVPPNRRLQLTAFGARDRAFFEVILESAPRRQLKRRPLGCLIRSHNHTTQTPRPSSILLGLFLAFSGILPHYEPRAI